MQNSELINSFIQLNKENINKNILDSALYTFQDMVLKDYLYFCIDVLWNYRPTMYKQFLDKINAGYTFYIVNERIKIGPLFSDIEIEEYKEEIKVTMVKNCLSQLNVYYISNNPYSTIGIISVELEVLMMEY